MDRLAHSYFVLIEPNLDTVPDHNPFMVYHSSLILLSSLLLLHRQPNVDDNLKAPHKVKEYHEMGFVVFLHNFLHLFLMNLSEML